MQLGEGRQAWGAGKPSNASIRSTDSQVPLAKSMFFRPTQRATLWHV